MEQYDWAELEGDVVAADAAADTVEVDQVVAAAAHAAVVTLEDLEEGSCVAIHLLWKSFPCPCEGRKKVQGLRAAE